LAAVLAILCVVCIGMSVAFRNDAGAVRAQLESMVLDEIDALREESREDIVAVARKLHSTLREQVGDLADQIEEVRDQLARDPAVATSGVSHQDATALSRGLVHTHAAQWRQATVRAAEANPYDSGTVRRADTARAADPVSGLPQRTAPAWSQYERRPAASQPVAAHGTSQPPRQHDRHPGSSGTSRRDPLGSGLGGTRGYSGQRPTDLGSSPVSASPVSPGPVSSSPVPPSPVSSTPLSPGLVPPAVPGTYSTAGTGGSYYASNGHPNGSGHGHPNGGVYSSGGHYTNGNGYSNGGHYQSGGGNDGRRHAPDPDGQVPVAAIESGHRTADPWADLRGDTEPTTSHHVGEAQDHGQGYHGADLRYGRASVGSVPYQQPEPPNRDWGGTYR
jgi:hypothetical protein